MLQRQPSGFDRIRRSRRPIRRIRHAGRRKPPLPNGNRSIPRLVPEITDLLGMVREPSAPREPQRGRFAVPLRTVLRARRVRLRVRLRHRRPALPGDRPRCADRPREPGASRRQRLREEHGRWRGNPPPGPVRVPHGGCRGAWRGAAPGGLRRGHDLPPPRPGEPGRLRGAHRGGPCRRGAGPAGLARRPRRRRRPGRDGQAEPARDPPGVRGPTAGRGGRPRFRPAPLRGAPADREDGLAQRAPRAGGLLHRVDELPDDRLQGDAQRVPAADVLPGHRRPAADQCDRDGPLALLDEHVPIVGARPSLPLHLAQRRDQHAARQRELAARPPVDVPLVGVRRGPPRRCSRRSTRTDPTRRSSTTCWSCSTLPGGRSPTA